ncbi:MAG: glutathione S-transferase family protein [Candidatus Phaeomarinobacter sp.]
MTDLRIFSYLPNPRLYKATIAARFSGAEIEVVGSKPRELVNWLWDYDARLLDENEKAELRDIAREAKMGFTGVNLYKTDAFLAAHPFGNVPAAFGEDGAIGLFESNSIMRAAARLGPNAGSLLGDGPLGHSRVDSVLDRALVFARDSQRYLLADDKMTDADYEEMETSLISFAAGLEQALTSSEFIAGDSLSLADIVVACELCQMTNERGFTDRLEAAGRQPLTPKLGAFSTLGTHLKRLSKDEKINADLDSYFARLLPIWN